MAWHQYQNGISDPFNQAWHQYQNGWFNQVAWHQYPQVYSKPHFHQVYWDPSHFGAYRHMYGFSHYPSSSTVNYHQINGVPPAGVFQQPGGATLEELPDTNQEAVSTADEVVSNDNNEEVDTETDSGVQHPNGKDQEEEISGQDNGIKQDVKDEEGKIVNGEDENTKQGEVTLQMETGREEKSENTPQENGLDHEEKTQHIDEAGLMTKKDKNA